MSDLNLSKSTLSLESHDAALLLASLFLYTVLAGTSIWRIVAFCLHQSRVSIGVTRNDGLFSQQQAVLRNVETPLSATWQLLCLAYAWRNRVRNPFARSIRLVVSALTILAGVIVAVLMTSRIVTQDATRIGYQNISMPGVGIIVALETLIVLLSSCFDTCLSSIREHFHYGRNGRLIWALDEKLQLQRMAFEGYGWGPFTKGASLIPVTEKDIILGFYDLDNPNHPTMLKNTVPSNGTGFWIDRRQGEMDLRPSTTDSVSEKELLVHARAYAEAQGQAFAWTAAPNSGETRGSSIIVGGLGGVRHLRIVNGGIDGTRCSSIRTVGTRRHSIASLGIANNPSLVSIASNFSSRDRRSHVSVAGVVSPQNSAFAKDPSLVSIASSLGPDVRKPHSATALRASGTSAFQERLPELRDLLQTDAGTAMVQQHTQHLLSPVQNQPPPSQVKPHGHSPLQYEHQQDEGGEYEHRAEIYGSREGRELELARLGGGETGSPGMRERGVIEDREERMFPEVSSQDFAFAEDGKVRDG